MFVAASSIMALCAFFQGEVDRGGLTKFALPLHFMALVLSYILFSLYIGRASYAASPIDFHRGWGLDVSFVAVPPRGVYWLWDILGLSVSRSSKEYFGDASVWISTFCLPIIVVALVSWFRTRRQKSVANTFLFIAAVSFYMALGPSLKINSTKPYPMGQAMPAEFAVAPTGSRLLYSEVPGIKSMRATYRWTALGVFSCWALVVLLLSGRGNSARLLPPLVGLLIITNLPNVPERVNSKMRVYEESKSLNHEIVDDMRSDVAKNDLVAFLPYDNDLLANYLSGTLAFRTYNIGGDKNLKIAKRFWPATMQAFTQKRVDNDFSSRLQLLLILDQADKVILPYIDMLWAVNYWPTPATFEDEIRTVVAQLRTVDALRVVERGHYAVIDLDKNYEGIIARRKLLAELCKNESMVSFCLSNSDFSLQQPNTQVGQIRGRSLVSHGAEGFLLYGPYKPLVAGRYAVELEGKFARISSDSWIDVIADHSTPQQTRFLKQSLSEFVTEDGTSGKTIVTIEKDLARIEFRVFIHAEDEVELTSYGLTPVLGDL